MSKTESAANRDAACGPAAGNAPDPETDALQAALAATERALAAAPDDVGVLSQRAELLVRSGAPERALECAERALALAPSADAHLLRGVILEELNRRVEALADYEAAIGLAPTCALGYYDRANVLADQGRLDEALADYARTLEHDPTYAPAHLNRGAVLQRRGDFAQARQAYDRALELDPRYALAYWARAEVRAALLDRDGAKADRRRARELEPPPPSDLPSSSSLNEEDEARDSS